MLSLVDALDTFLTTQVAPLGPGCAVAVVHRGHILLSRGYGLANLEHHVPITPQTRFQIGSASKQFTAMCIFLLVAQGTVGLDDAIRRYLPEMPAHAQPITIRHLMHHTSGLREALTLLAYTGWNVHADILSRETILHLFAQQHGLNFVPGSHFEYNNSNYFLLAELVQRVSGHSLNDFAAEQIFAPLGMDQTQFSNTVASIDAPQAVGYIRASDAQYTSAPQGVGIIGAAGLFTTVTDFLRWDRNFDEGQIGGTALIDQLLTPGRLINGRPLHYAGGLFVQKYHGLRLISHAGGFPGVSAYFVRLPELQLSTMFLCNHNELDLRQLALQLVDRYLADDGRAVAPQRMESKTGQEEDLLAYTGAFWNVRAGWTCTVTIQEGCLVIQLYQTSPSFPARFQLTSIGRGRFQAGDALDTIRVTFVPADAGRPRRMYLLTEGEAEEVLEAFAPVTPTFEQLDAYSGTYTSDELPITLSFARDGDSLVSPLGSYEPTIADGFRGPYGMHIVFQRAGDQHVTGLRLYADMASNIAFVRVSDRATNA
jgi:CubicO group peptidase (beta-lactamase class C family)